MTNLAVQFLFIIFIPVLQSSANIVKTAKVASNVSFECETNASKPLRWKFLGSADSSLSQWIHLGEEFAKHWLSLDRTHVSFNSANGTGFMSIVNVQKSDSGNYSCLLAANREPMCRFELYVTALQSSADIVKTANVGSNVSFECKTDSSEPLRWKFMGSGRELTTLWIYNGVKFGKDWLSCDRTNVSFNSATGTGLLSIANLHESDSGNYSCLLIKEEEPLNWFNLFVITGDEIRPIKMTENQPTTSTTSRLNKSHLNFTTLPPSTTTEPMFGNNVAFLLTAASALLIVVAVVLITVVVHRVSNTNKESLSRMLTVMDNYERTRSRQLSLAASQFSVHTGNGSGRFDGTVTTSLTQSTPFQQLLPFQTSSRLNPASAAILAANTPYSLAGQSANANAAEANDPYADLTAFNRAAAANLSQQPVQPRHSANTAVYAEIDHRLSGLHNSLH